jgi:hypothetical protein
MPRENQLPAVQRPSRSPSAPADASAQRLCPQPSTSRGSTPSTSWLPYAEVIAGRAIPHPSSGPLKPIAKGSAHANSAVSSKTALRRNSSELPGHLSGMPAGATFLQAHEINVVPAGQKRKKTPIVITGVSDTRGFSAWLRATCRSSFTAQIKAERLVLVPETADGFRATVTALRSLDDSRGVSFHTFSQPKDRSVRLLVKNVGKTMPDCVVQEELAALGISAQGVMQLRSGRRSQDGTQDRLLTPHFNVSVPRGPEVTKLRSLTEHCGLRISVETYAAPKGPVQCKRCQRLGHTRRNCGYTPRCVACGEAHQSGGCSTPKEQLKCCGCEGNHTASWLGSV